MGRRSFAGVVYKGIYVIQGRIRYEDYTEDIVGVIFLCARRCRLVLCGRMDDSHKAGERADHGASFGQFFNWEGVCRADTGIYLFVAGWRCMVCRVYAERPF